jgi:two-component system nitrate/nitrite response regulator NarL
MAIRSRVNVDNHTPAATPASPANSHVEELIRLIAAKTASSVNSQSSQSASAEQILLDINLDGERYLLVRMLKPSHIPLSPREIEIVRMVAQGHSNKIIADVLGISSWTVCTHVRRIFGKLGVGSRSAMVARLLERGALTNREPRLYETFYEIAVPSGTAISSVKTHMAPQSNDTARRPMRRTTAKL